METEAGLAVDQSLEVLGVPGSLHLDLGGGGVLASCDAAKQVHEGLAGAAGFWGESGDGGAEVGGVEGGGLVDLPGEWAVGTKPMSSSSTVGSASASGRRHHSEYAALGQPEPARALAFLGLP
jgi:hypothetical protein